MPLLQTPIQANLNAVFGMDEEARFFASGKPSRTITDIAVGNPAIITVPDHCYQSGDLVVISKTNCCPTIESLGEVWTVTRVDTNTFSIPANVNLHGGTTGKVEGPLQSLTGWTFDGGIFECETVTVNRFLDAAADATNISQRVVLKSNSLAEISRLWDSITIVNAAVDQTYLASPVTPMDASSVAFGQEIYEWQRVITLETQATATIPNARVRVFYKEKTGNLDLIVVPTIAIVGRQVSISFENTQLTAAINGCHFLVFANSPVGERTRFIDGLCSYSEC